MDQGLLRTSENFQRLFSWELRRVLPRPADRRRRSVLSMLKPFRSNKTTKNVVFDGLPSSLMLFGNNRRRPTRKRGAYVHGLSQHASLVVDTLFRVICSLVFVVFFQKYKHLTLLLRLLSGSTLICKAIKLALHQHICFWRCACCQGATSSAQQFIAPSPVSLRPTFVTARTPTSRSYSYSSTTASVRTRITS